LGEIKKVLTGDTTEERWRQLRLYLIPDLRQIVKKFLLAEWEDSIDEIAKREYKNIFQNEISKAKKAKEHNCEIGIPWDEIKEESKIKTQWAKTKITRKSLGWHVNEMPGITDDSLDAFLGGKYKQNTKGSSHRMMKMLLIEGYSLTIDRMPGMEIVLIISWE